MKLSDKYINKILFPDGKVAEHGAREDSMELYGKICALEAQKTLLVGNQSYMKHERFIEQLAEVTNALQEIAEKEGL